MEQAANEVGHNEDDDEEDEDVSVNFGGGNRVQHNELQAKTVKLDGNMLPFGADEEEEGEREEENEDQQEEKVDDEEAAVEMEKEEKKVFAEEANEESAQQNQLFQDASMEQDQADEMGEESANSLAMDDSPIDFGNGDDVSECYYI